MERWIGSPVGGRKKKDGPGVVSFSSDKRHLLLCNCRGSPETRNKKLCFSYKLKGMKSKGDEARLGLKRTSERI